MNLGGLPKQFKKDFLQSITILVGILFQAALSGYAAFAQENPNIADARRYIREEQLDRAERILINEAGTVNADNAEAWYLSGYIYARQRQYNKMSEAFARAAALKPEFKTQGVEIEEGAENKISARDGVDFILQSLWGENFARGIKYFNDALNAESEPAREINLEQSAVFFRTAAKIIPDSALAHRNLGATLMKLNKSA
jgi:tetratricopeptide (TPR) repeat protein